MSESNTSQVETQKAMTDQAAASERAEEAIKSCPYWFHSIALAPGITTKCAKTARQLETELRSLHLPDLCGKTVSRYRGRGWLLLVRC